MSSKDYKNKAAKFVDSVVDKLSKTQKVTVDEINSLAKSPKKSTTKNKKSDKKKKDKQNIHDDPKFQEYILKLRSDEDDTVLDSKKEKSIRKFIDDKFKGFNFDFDESDDEDKENEHIRSILTEAYWKFGPDIFYIEDKNDEGFLNWPRHLESYLEHLDISYNSNTSTNEENNKEDDIQFEEKDEEVHDSETLRDFAKSLCKDEKLRSFVYKQRENYENEIKMSKSKKEKSIRKFFDDKFKGFDFDIDEKSKIEYMYYKEIYSVFNAAYLKFGVDIFLLIDNLFDDSSDNENTWFSHLSSYYKMIDDEIKEKKNDKEEKKNDYENDDEFIYENNEEDDTMWLNKEIKNINRFLDISRFFDIPDKKHTKKVTKNAIVEFGKNSLNLYIESQDSKNLPTPLVIMKKYLNDN